ncbi:MAG: hypothetical protein IJ774_05460 [Selenomonadaceae bacterium]|nr:hypothetical protein [Selenomonadaceae bacterium]MBR1805822.1 hypothetical protein [Selenomonadaceae bacterium]
MFGKIKLENFDACKLPQKAASAWTAVEDLIGATYKPLVYLGEQPVNGTNYYFVAEQTLMTNPLIRRVIKFAIYERDGEYTLLDESITEIA